MCPLCFWIVLSFLSIFSLIFVLVFTFVGLLVSSMDILWHVFLKQYLHVHQMELE